MKKLQDILYKINCQAVRGNSNPDIRGIAQDSRQVMRSYLFVAVRGNISDGHLFIDKAIEAGAVAIICEAFPSEIRPDVTYVLVENSAMALGMAASNYYDNPSRKLKLIGITGTNGKTTTATLLYRLFTKLGYNSGLISTISVSIKEKTIPATHTTPDAVSLNSLLAKMHKAGVTHCFMEVSSHATIQHRIAGLFFAAGVFTNITHDHLDYHGSFKNYIAAKKMFFDGLHTSAFALSNIDDKNGELMLQNCKAAKHYYGIKTMATFKAKILENDFDGLNLNVNGHNTWFKLIGSFNAYNLLAVFGTAELLGEEPRHILAALSDLPSAEGRFEYFRSTHNITCIVDYAHTPDALKNVLETINNIRTGNEKLITVFGCGGNRDKTKRPVMGKIASENSNIIIITSDNPRFEHPSEIITEIRMGLDVQNSKKVLVIENRGEAIKTACLMAKAGDIILVAGKGHEKYQEIEGVKHPFDDMQVLKENFTEKK